MNSPRRSALLLLGFVAFTALVLRLPHLSHRPMHNDEAVNTVRFQPLLEHGRFAYDPNEYHGPALPYATLIPAWLTGESTLAETDEVTFRSVNIAFGVGLIVLLWLVRDALGHWAMLAAGLLCAVSPAMVFYSRMHVHEMLLVFFTFSTIACGWRYTVSRRWWWALAAGVSIGLMHATKETCIIAWIAMAAALLITARGRVRMNWRHALIGAAGAVIVSVTLFSAFFTNWHGPVDSVMTYTHYFGRALGEDRPHIYGPLYYVKLLGYTRYPTGPVFSEWPILLFGLLGIIAAFVRLPPGEPQTAGTPHTSHPAPAFVRFLAVYAIILLIIYSAIPYKTPWLMLSFLHACTLLAAIGAAWAFRAVRPAAAKLAIGALLALGVVHLTHQQALATGRYEADRRNPYVYAHTATDIHRLVARVESIAAVHPEKRGMSIAVIADNPWPLPWYLRRYSHVGYWQTMPEQPDAAMVIVSADLLPQFDTAATGTYQREHFAQRPEVFVLACTRQDLWDKMLAAQINEVGVNHD